MIHIKIAFILSCSTELYLSLWCVHVLSIYKYHHWPLYQPILRSNVIFLLPLQSKWCHLTWHTTKRCIVYVVIVIKRTKALYNGNWKILSLLSLVVIVSPDTKWYFCNVDVINAMLGYRQCYNSHRGSSDTCIVYKFTFLWYVSLPSYALLRVSYFFSLVVIHL